MKSWKWYAKQLRENPPFRLDESKSYSWIKSHKKRKKFIKIDRKAAQRARDFEKENGFAFEDCWNLDVAIAKFLYPRLAYLRDNHKGVPAIIDSEFETIEESDKEWTRILNRMTKGFYVYAAKEDYEYTDDEKALIEETKELLIKYFSCLWD
jgi:hypothetical protein